MQEDNYKDLYQKIIAKTCVFEKSILQRFADCQSADKHLLAEREAINCDSLECHNQCLQFHKKVRAQSRFTFQQTSLEEPLPHNKELRLQVGGLLGLKLVLSGENTEQINVHLKSENRYEGRRSLVSNILALLKEANIVFGSVEQLPYLKLVRSISLISLRKQRHRPNSE